MRRPKSGVQMVHARRGMKHMNHFPVVAPQRRLPAEQRRWNVRLLAKSYRLSSSVKHSGPEYIARVEGGVDHN